VQKIYHAYAGSKDKLLIDLPINPSTPDWLEFGREYNPLDNENITTTLFHGNLGWFKGGVTLETSVDVDKERNRWHSVYRIIGTPRAIKFAKRKLEQKTQTKLELDK